MIKNYSVRTDLALEEKERFESDHVEISGVVLEEDYDEASELRVTRVEIKTENGAKAMGKPVGTYLTIETPNLAMPDEKSQTVIAEKVCSFIKELIRKFEVKDKDLSILVVGLGNRASYSGFTGTLRGRSFIRDAAYCKRIWKICNRSRRRADDQRCRAGSDGANGNGKCGDRAWDCIGNES